MFNLEYNNQYDHAIHDKTFSLAVMTFPLHLCNFHGKGRRFDPCKVYVLLDEINHHKKAHSCTNE